MNRDLLETQWPRVREILSEKFPNLTEEDIRQINGRYDQLVAKLQQKYGYTREEAEEKIQSWNFDKFATGFDRTTSYNKNPSSYNERAAKEADSSILPWIIGLGVPLIILGYLFFNTPTITDTTRAQTTAAEQARIETPADRTLSSNLRSALLADPNVASDISNVQITSSNGVVSLFGTVASTQARDFIINQAQTFPGVLQVNSHLQVK